MDTPTIHPKAVLVLVLASYTMIVLDISIVITALPKIHYALGFSSAGIHTRRPPARQAAEPNLARSRSTRGRCR